jgi:hypothetical protein
MKMIRAAGFNGIAAIIWAEDWKLKIKDKLDAGKQ